MARRSGTSLVLLTVLLAGTITPTGVCAFMCERRARTESQHHCNQPSDGMPGMAHDHSAMNHLAVRDVSLVMVSPSCQTNCFTAERLNVSRKAVPQVNAVESGAVFLDVTAKFLVPHPAAAWISDNSPPSSPSASAASFRILRI